MAQEVRENGKDGQTDRQSETESGRKEGKKERTRVDCSSKLKL